MKKLLIFMVMFLALGATQELMAQNKVSRAERKVMRKSVAEDKEDQKNYGRKQKRNERRMDKREKHLSKKRKSNMYEEASSCPSSYLLPYKSEEIEGCSEDE